MPKTAPEAIHPLQSELEELQAYWKPVHIEIIDDSIVMIVSLIAHVALYLNPTLISGADERYCYSNLDIALIAIEDFKQTKEFKFWQKDHNRGLVVSDNLLYLEHEHQIPENALKEVPWNADDISNKFPHKSMLLDLLLSR